MNRAEHHSVSQTNKEYREHRGQVKEKAEYKLPERDRDIDFEYPRMKRSL